MLYLLVQGDTEKQAAVRLGVSQPTAHEYVVALSRRCGVHDVETVLISAVPTAGATDPR